MVDRKAYLPYLEARYLVDDPSQLTFTTLRALRSSIYITFVPVTATNDVGHLLSSSERFEMPTLNFGTCH